MNAELELTGVLLTMFDTRTNVSKAVRDELMANPRTGAVLFETIVRQNIKIAESQGAGMPVIHFDPECHGAEAYRELALEVVRRAGEAAREPQAPDAAGEPDGDDAGAESSPDPFTEAELRTPPPEEAPKDDFTRRISHWWDETADRGPRKDAASGV